MAVNARQKGKRGERWFVNNGLRDIWPGVMRNAAEQAQCGGTDLKNTPGWAWELKFGKAYKSKMIRNIIDQAQEQGKDTEIKIAGIKPDREEPYVIIPWSDFLKVLKNLPQKLQ